MTSTVLRNNKNQQTNSFAQEIEDRLGTAPSQGPPARAKASQSYLGGETERLHQGRGRPQSRGGHRARRPVLCLPGVFKYCNPSKLLPSLCSVGLSLLVCEMGPLAALGPARGRCDQAAGCREPAVQVRVFGHSLPSVSGRSSQGRAGLGVRATAFWDAALAPLLQRTKKWEVDGLREREDETPLKCGPEI